MAADMGIKFTKKNSYVKIITDQNSENSGIKREGKIRESVD